MSAKVVPLTIELTDIITPKSLSFFIAELIKYFAYNKQQIPFPYERLKMYVLRRRERQKTIEMTDSTGGTSTSVRVAFLMEKYYKKVEEAFEILDSTFKCIEEQLTTANGNSLEEVVLLFGATPLSPKDVYRIQIPSLTYGHSEDQHLWRRQVANLFRNIIISDEVNDNLQRKVGLTNMYVMMKMRRSDRTNSKWLLPKDHYRLSERAQQVCLSFHSRAPKPCSCSVEVIQFTSLSQDMAALRVSDQEPHLQSSDVDASDQFVWFQTPRTLKGFKDCKSEGKSVTDLWYKYSFIS